MTPLYNFTKTRDALQQLDEASAKTPQAAKRLSDLEILVQTNFQWDLVHRNPAQVIHNAPPCSLDFIRSVVEAHDKNHAADDTQVAEIVQAHTSPGCHEPPNYGLIIGICLALSVVAWALIGCTPTEKSHCMPTTTRTQHFPCTSASGFSAVPGGKLYLLCANGSIWRDSLGNAERSCWDRIRPPALAL
jgi:hypothetical protein